MPRIGIVGTGFMGKTHAAQLSRMADVDVTAVAARHDPTDFVEELDLDAATYPSAEALFSNADLDGVSLCTPTNTHRALVEQAFDAGIDVLCEKPLASTVSEAKSIAEHSRTVDETLLVGHVLRFFPAYRRAKEMVDAGDIGSSGVARARRLSPFPDWGSGDWYADRSASGGVFLDLAIHDLDFLQWTWGEVQSVFARRVRDDRFEHGHATLTFDSGATGYVEAGWSQPPERELTTELELAGEDGLIEHSSTDEHWYDRYGIESDPVPPKDGYWHELRHFVECVRGDSTPSVSAQEAVEAIALSEAAARSTERGRPVEVSEVMA
jgi:UDP-N-acetylglucosamine 3-dehydrogenase